MSAYVRRCSAAGAFAAISRKGDESAGAVFVECLHGNGADLYGPHTFDDGRRGFEKLLSGAPYMDVTERIEREASFDRDLWLVTVEDRDGRAFFTADEYE
ncbi:DUF1491 family protein [Acuticoccus sp. M5D2P5]|uniref:DUF1491 family protein n=1 Tax=Acuticoccus kalidii TaxID=2910977 RepID=UPI001F3F7F95|nr:DUF1491 family protein [Acuticoccus kalidii]